MNNQHIHHDLIGTIPAMEVYRDRLEQIIAEYKSTKPPTVELGLMSDTERAEYFEEESKKPHVMRRATLGLLIDLCGTHFYGLNSLDFARRSDFLDELEAIEDELKSI